KIDLRLLDSAPWFSSLPFVQSDRHLRHLRNLRIRIGGLVFAIFVFLVASGLWFGKHQGPLGDRDPTAVLSREVEKPNRLLLAFHTLALFALFAGDPHLGSLCFLLFNPFG